MENIYYFENDKAIPLGSPQLLEAVPQISDFSGRFHISAHVSPFYLEENPFDFSNVEIISN